VDALMVADGMAATRPVKSPAGWLLKSSSVNTNPKKTEALKNLRGFSLPIPVFTRLFQ
jgi:hypothetical protein